MSACSLRRTSLVFSRLSRQESCLNTGLLKKTSLCKDVFDQQHKTICIDFPKLRLINDFIIISSKIKMEGLGWLGIKLVTLYINFVIFILHGHNDTMYVCDKWHVYWVIATTANVCVLKSLVCIGGNLFGQLQILWSFQRYKNLTIGQGSTKLRLIIIEKVLGCYIFPSLGDEIDSSVT